MPKPKRRSAPVALRFNEEKVETARAYLLVLEDGEEAWFPKSQIVSIDWNTGTLQVPRWLAEEKGLLAAEEEDRPPGRLH